MSKRKASLLVIFAVVILFSLRQQAYAHEEGSAAPLHINGEAAILMDAKTGAVLYQKNPEQRMFPASITKIITGIIALETANHEDMVTVSKEARYEEGTRVFLAEGEQQTMEKLIYAVLLNSGNDAATAIAEHIDGSKDQFAARMNAFVQEKVGTTQTQFMNPHGLPDPNQYTTAQDMALIARYAMLNDRFRTIVSTKTMPWQGEEWQSELVNHNKLLWRYEGATGIKNGFTQAAGFTLVASAEREDMELIGVVLQSSTNEQLYSDMTELLDYGFEHYEPRMILSKNQKMQYAGEEFIARDPVWITAAKHEQPVLSVDLAGNLFVEASLYNKSTPVAMLLPAHKEEALEVTTASLTISEAAAASAPQSKWRYPLAVLWFLLNGFLALIAWALWRRGRLRH